MVDGWWLLNVYVGKQGSIGATCMAGGGCHNINATCRRGVCECKDGFIHSNGNCGE